MKDLIAMIENSKNFFNGHNQITFPYISNKRLLKLYKKLSDRYKNEDFWIELQYCYSSHLDGELSASMYKVYGDNNNILLCSFDEVTNTKVFKDSGDNNKDD